MRNISEVVYRVGRAAQASSRAAMCGARRWLTRWVEGAIQPEVLMNVSVQEPFWRICLAVPMLAILSVSPAAAATITFEFEAEVREVTDYTSLLGGTVAAADVFSGSFSFDSSAVDANPLSWVGHYDGTSSPWGIGFTLGGYVFQTDPANVVTAIEVVDQVNNDAYLFRSLYNLPPGPGLQAGQIDLQLTDPTGTAFSTTALPLTPPDVSLFTQPWGLVVFGGVPGGDEGSPFFAIYSTVTSMTVAASEVPEPSQLSLLAAGAAFGASRLRRRA
jgi:hypothetical protein